MCRLARFTVTCLLGCSFTAASLAQEQDVYLNNDNMTVSLGASMSADPFRNSPTEEIIRRISDAASAGAEEFHDPNATHVWLTGGPLELDFDFGREYDLTTVHFWNYHSESHDVDNIDWTFFDSSRNLVGTIANVAPRLGAVSPSDGSPITAENISLDFPTRIQFVNAVLTGSNGEVDFNNIGFTGTVSVPEPNFATIMPWLVATLLAVRSRVRK